MRYSERHTITAPIAHAKVLILVPLAYEAGALARFAGGLVRVHTIGPGGGRLPTSAGGAEVVILAGVAGGLDSTLRVGDVVVDEQSTVNERRWPCVRIATVDEAASTPEAKRSLRDRTGAAAVEMEAERVREWAERLSLPWLHIRAISDSAGDALPPAMSGWVNDRGGTRPLAVLRDLVLRRVAVKDVLRVRGASAMALNNLARAMEEVLLGLTGE